MGIRSSSSSRHGASVVSQEKSCTSDVVAMFEIFGQTGGLARCGLPSCHRPGYQALLRCPVGDPGGSMFHGTCGLTWRVTIDRHKR